MEKEYNDEILMSPDQMGLIAKEYFNFLNKKNTCGFNKTEEYKHVCKLILLAQKDVLYIKKLCRFKNEHLVNLILHNFAKLKNVFYLEPQDDFLHESKPSKLIKHSLTCLCDALILLNQNPFEHNASYMQQVLNLIKLICKL